MASLGGGGAIPPSTAFCDDPELQPEAAVAAWMAARLARELERVRALGQRAVGVPLRNCGLVVEDADGGGGARGAKKRQAEGATIHRIEAATAFDFARVKHLLFSPPEPCDVKLGYVFINVVLLIGDDADATGSPPALVLPYLVEDRPGMSFARWRLVNNKLVETDILVDDADTVQ
jgi:hypothetical protein